MCATTACHAAAKPHVLPLTSVAEIGDLDTPPFADDPGTGGGFDTAGYFQTRLATPSKITFCADKIEAAAAAWATGLGLSRNLRDREATALTLHYVKPGMAGFFNVAYRVEGGVRARVRVDFYALNGDAQAPEAARSLLEPYKIAALEDSLDSALKCEGAVR